MDPEIEVVKIYRPADDGSFPRVAAGQSQS